MITVRELPQKYEAIQFDMVFASKYGLIKYPMLKRRKHSTYGDTHERLPVNSVWQFDNDDVVVVSDGIIDGFNSKTGVVRICDDQGVFCVKAPMVQKEHSERWLSRLLSEPAKSVYDFDAPELSDYVYNYYLDSTVVNNKDWIVTDSEGKSEVYTPDEFLERFEKSEKGNTDEK